MIRAMFRHQLMVLCAAAFGSAGSFAADGVPFDWANGAFAGQQDVRVALLLPAELNGKPCVLQLDTGMPDAVRWHVADASPRAVPHTMTLSFAGMSRRVHVPDAVSVPLDAEGRCAGTSGSIGNAFFEHGTLTLDLGRARATFNAGSDLAHHAGAQPMAYRRGQPHGDHPLVAVRGTDGEMRQGLLDTGSSAIGLGALTAADWSALTGSAPLAPTDRVGTFTVHSWGRTLTCFRTAAAGNVSIGVAPARPIQVTYCPDLAFKPEQPLIGVIGLQPFGNATITLDYVAGRWLVTE
jgi:hypothetical protein